MRLGIVTPVVTLLPRAHARWEETAGIAQVAAIAEHADRLGYDHLTASEHIAVPRDIAPTRGSTYWDPLATLAYLAAVTSNIRLATYVLVLGYHHPLEIVKRYSTLDLISGGRVVLGLGVGSLEEEFTLIGAPFSGRGPLADESLQAIRSSWGQREPSWPGPHYRFEDVIVEPIAPRSEVEIWVGGRTERSMERAIAYGDAWAPFGLSPSEISAALAKGAMTDAFIERTKPLGVLLAPVPPVDPIGDPDKTLRVVEELAAAGATMLTLRFISNSHAHYLEQLEAMVALIAI